MKKVPLPIVVLIITFVLFGCQSQIQEYQPEVEITEPEKLEAQEDEVEVPEEALEKQEELPAVVPEAIIKEFKPFQEASVQLVEEEEIIVEEPIIEEPIVEEPEEPIVKPTEEEPKPEPEVDPLIQIEKCKNYAKEQSELFGDVLLEVLYNKLGSSLKFPPQVQFTEEQQRGFSPQQRKDIQAARDVGWTAWRDDIFEMVEEEKEKSYDRAYSECIDEL